MSDIKKVGVVGEGKMGSGIFYYLLDFDFELAWLCSLEADVDKINKQFNKKIKRSADAGIISHSTFEKLQKTSISKDISLMHDCDLLIEAVPENLDLKKDLFARLDQVVKAGAIFATNASSINPSEMAPDSRRKETFTGLHFFYPPTLKNIVEFTTTKDLSGQTQDTIEAFLHNIKRRFITLDEKNSFLLNRIFLDVQNEAYLILKTVNCSYLQMDHLVKNHLFPFGIFDFCDSVGLDTMRASIVNYIRDYPHKSHYAAFIKTLEELISQGRLGMKTQMGFYKYPFVEIPPDEPENVAEIVDHLHQTWLSSSKRYTSTAHIPIDDANYAIREYFDISSGPFE